MSKFSKEGLTCYTKGISGFLIDDNAIEKKETYVVIANIDSGKTFYSKKNGMGFKLPDISSGSEFGNIMTFINMADDGLAKQAIIPSVNDSIVYAGSSVVGEDLVNTNSNSKKGDYVTLSNFNDLNYWHVIAIRGIWIKLS